MQLVVVYPCSVSVGIHSPIQFVLWLLSWSEGGTCLFQFLSRGSRTTRTETSWLIILKECVGQNSQVARLDTNDNFIKEYSNSITAVCSRLCLPALAVRRRDAPEVAGTFETSADGVQGGSHSRSEFQEVSAFDTHPTFVHTKDTGAKQLVHTDFAVDFRLG